MRKPDDISDTFWGRFKTSEELESFCRPALVKAAAAQDKVRAEARARREAKSAAAAAAAAADEATDPDASK